MAQSHSTSTTSWALAFPNSCMVPLSISHTTRLGVTQTTNIGLETRSPLLLGLSVLPFLKWAYTTKLPSSRHLKPPLVLKSRTNNHLSASLLLLVHITSVVLTKFWLTPLPLPLQHNPNPKNEILEGRAILYVPCNVIFTSITSKYVWIEYTAFVRNAHIFTTRRVVDQK